MAQFVQNPYKDTNNQYYKKFKELLTNTPIGVWKAISNDTYIYKNNKGYFHICKIWKSAHAFYINDYLLTANCKNELKSTYGDFDESKLIEFLKQKQKNN